MRVTLGALREHFSYVLAEGRVDDARDEVPDMEEEDFDYLVANQPGGSNNKYLLWSVRQAETMLEADPDKQALTLVIQAVRLFNGNIQRLKQRDLNQYKTVGEVETAVQELGKSKGEQAKQVRSDTDTIYQDDQFVVIRPHTTEASCKYGTGTKWCIAATGSHNYYSSYSTSNHKFYFVIDKRAKAGDPDSKFAFAIMAPGSSATGSNVQIYDAADKLASEAHVAKVVGDKWPEIWSKIQDHVKAHPVTREVEEAQKATEEHVKELLAGKSVSQIAINKIAKDGKLTSAVINAILKHFENYVGPEDHRDIRQDVIASLSSRIAEIPPESAMKLIKWTASTRPADAHQYWSGRYYLAAMFQRAALTADDFRELIKTGDESIMVKVMTNPNTPADIKQQIAAKVKDFQQAENRTTVYLDLIMSGDITKEQFKTALETDKYGNLKGTMLNNSRDAKLSADLIPLIPVLGPQEFKRVMQLPNISPTYAGQLINKAWKLLPKHDLYDALKTANIDTSYIDELWQDKGQDVRIALLQNPAIGTKNASKFARSKNSAYRFAVAHNPNTLDTDLQLLATDESVSTRSAVASNPNTPTETLTKLGGDEAVAVRASVGSNAATPRNTLNALLKDTDDFVRKSVRKTLKSLGTTEALVHLMSGMRGMLLEELTDDDTPDIMVPSYKDLHYDTTRLPPEEFIAIYLLQNNGSATREDIEAAYNEFCPWTPRMRTRWQGHRRVQVPDARKSLWSKLLSAEKYDGKRVRATHAGGNGWWWAPAGITARSLFRLTPAGAAVAMNILARERASKPDADWTRRDPPEVRKSPPPKELDPNKANAAPAATAAPRGPKTTYKIYGKFKGHPAATRLKGKAYVAPANTEFSAGEQAYINVDGDKLKVKKADSDHTQTWDPIDG
jgi:hypothetical protein